MIKASEKKQQRSLYCYANVCTKKANGQTTLTSRLLYRLKRSKCYEMRRLQNNKSNATCFKNCSDNSYKKNCNKSRGIPCKEPIRIQKGLWYKRSNRSYANAMWKKLGTWKRAAHMPCGLWKGFWQSEMNKAMAYTEENWNWLER